ncbi:MAG TPA: pyruvate kinase, partial [Gammaproteobacteria bacterium]|nr:pyruvate kinase [Gammaproteobacteria bacterium]
MDPRRRTKIIASLGPSTDKARALSALIREGVDVARINMSHGSLDDHRRRATMLRECARDLDRPVALLLDLQGPKIRIQGFRNGKVQLRNGRKFSIDPALGPEEGTEESVGTTYSDLPQDVKVGDNLLLDDGNIT